MKGSPGKAPSINWYYKDWLSDTELQQASASTRGIWVNLLMHMLEREASDKDTPGELRRISIKRLCNLGRCSPDEAKLFIEEAKELEFCGIDADMSTTCPDCVRILSRRLQREIQERIKWREQKRNQRSRAQQERGTSSMSTESPGQVQPSRARPIPNPIPTSKNPPAEDEVRAFFAKKKWPADEAIRFFEYYDTTGWNRKDGSPVFSWKGQAVTWMSYKKGNSNTNGGISGPVYTFPECGACGQQAINIIKGQTCPFCGGVS